MKKERAYKTTCEMHIANTLHHIEMNERSRERTSITDSSNSYKMLDAFRLHITTTTTTNSIFNVNKQVSLCLPFDSSLAFISA